MKMNIPLHFYDDESSTLSANAPEFYPSCMYNGNDNNVEIAIYNDGIPEMTLMNEHDRCVILHGIEDQAIDEQFPPNADEAAELEAVDNFVIEMANLDYLEELEEKARTNFCHIKKRWEARRAHNGPSVGRGPRPPMNLIIPNDHNNVKQKHITDIIPCNQAHKMIVHQDKLRTKEIKTYRRIEPRHMKMTSMNQRLPIQQPRKMN